LAGLRLDPNPPAVHLDDALRYGKSQAGAALLARDCIVGLLKLLKQLGLISSRDARTGVTDGYIERAIVRFSLDGDFARIGELDGSSVRPSRAAGRQCACELATWGYIQDGLAGWAAM
jgi:hypothetical protein